MASLNQAQAFLAAGNAFRAAGRLDDAIGAYRRAVVAAPEGAAGHYNLGLVLRESRDWRGAALAFRDAARLGRGTDYDAIQNAVATLGAAVEAGAAPFAHDALPATGRGTPISIVVCSVRPGLLGEMRRSYESALGDREHEFIVVGDARSLGEGYTRGLALARHPIVVFSHDDVEIFSPRAFDAIERALASHDIVGIAGSQLARGPAVMWAGHPHLRGLVAIPGRGKPGAVDATVFSLECGILGGMQTLDGFFIAARREAAIAIGFDAATFDGFHFYDLDFTWRAHLAGMRIAVTTEVCALHRSLGNFAGDWQRCAIRFAEKFPRLSGSRGPNHHFAAPLASRENAVRFHAQLHGLAAA
ncbi:MAG TPA: glycosyltransferase [Usitatibacter sp.]|nr:glycosyltransferase [Usitatibacter sp.]